MERVTIKTFKIAKKKGEKLSALAAYDFTFAKIVDEAGVDVVLVGDSATNVFAGHHTTLPMTLDQTIYHAQAVVRGVKRAMVVVDMPFGSYQVNKEKAVSAAIRVMKETGATAVKLEGAEPFLEIIQKLTQIGIPVMGHLGLTPQSVHIFGGYDLQAKEKEDAEKMKKDALALEEAGCFALVLEKIPHLLAETLTRDLKVSTVGIGAGKYCDAQVLVSYDMLGMNPNFKPKFVRYFSNFYEQMIQAFSDYDKAVKTGKFPSENEQY